MDAVSSHIHDFSRRPPTKDGVDNHISFLSITDDGYKYGRPCEKEQEKQCTGYCVRRPPFIFDGRPSLLLDLISTSLDRCSGNPMGGLGLSDLALSTTILD
jgi:hypothetical protein